MPKPRLTALDRQIRELKKAFVRIQHSLERVAKRARTADASRQKPSRSGRRLKLSAARRATLQLQGAYMGFMRQLGPRQKVRVKSLKEAKGFKPAIAMARRLAGK